MMLMSIGRRTGLLLVTVAAALLLASWVALANDADARRRHRLPDLVPVPQIPGIGEVGFCKIDQGQLVVTVKNQGKRDARASTTKVTFDTGDSVSQSTPLIPKGSSIDLRFNIPAGSFDSDSDFTIKVDSNNQVRESREGNNTAFGRCIG